jgi:exodeoxyribonuclease VII large subunit
MAVFSVLQLNEYIKDLLESEPQLAAVTVKGEISNFIHHRSGHMYFTLKDEDSQIKAVMFRGANMRLTFRPENGQKVVVMGQVSVYPAGGQYQLYVGAMRPDGIGDLYQAYEKLKKQLTEEGLFDERHKKPLPAFPQKIGVITSANGAAVRDIMNVVGRRCPMAQLLLYPAQVQGAGTDSSLIRGLDYFEAQGDIDVIIIGRGGGSLEDLWGFNSERLARRIFEMNTPVISAVGHETDFTICDFVSDKRAPTPSAAAEIAVPDLRVLRQRLDDASDRAVSAALLCVDDRRKRLKEEAASYEERSVERLFRLKEEKLKGLVGRTHSLSPLAVLSRGYAVASKDGKALKNTEGVSVGDEVELRLQNGKLIAEVTQVGKEN